LYLKKARLMVSYQSTKLNSVDMSQKEKILQHLQKKSITPIEALELYGCFRLAARVWDLKNDGHKILGIKDQSKNFCRYRIVK